jgi:hypothetical protein
MPSRNARVKLKEHVHSIVTLGMRGNGQIDLMDLTQIPRSTGVEHIEEDLNLVMRKINQYQPDIICPDLGLTYSSTK